MNARKLISLVAALALSCTQAWAQTEAFGTYVGGLPAAGSSSGADSLYILQGGTSKKISPTLIGGVPSAPTTSVQFNSSGAFGGDAGFTYAGNGQVTHALGTITANAQALNITGTWNNGAVVFDAPLFMNITNTASAAGSLLADLQVGGNSVFSFGLSSGAGAFQVYNVGGTNFERGVFDFTTTANVLTVGTQKGGTGSIRNLQFVVGGTKRMDFGINATLTWSMGGTGSTTSQPVQLLLNDFSNTGSGTIFPNMEFNAQNIAGVFAFGEGDLGSTTGRFWFGGAALGGAWDTSTAAGHRAHWEIFDGGLGLGAGGTVDGYFYRDAVAGVIALARGNPTAAASAGAAGFRLYNSTDQVATFTAPTNYERAVFDWTSSANVLTIGTQKGGTGSARSITLTSQADLIVQTQGSNNLAMVNANSNWPTIPNGQGWGWTTNNQANGTLIAGLRYANGSTGPAVIGFVDGSANLTGWMQWAGEKRVTADVNNATVTLATATGLSIALAAGRTYSCDVELSWTDAAAGGLQLALVATGGLTATNIIYDGWIVDSAANGIKGNTQATALGGVVASSTTTGTAGHAVIQGTITVNVAGTINVQFAQNTSSATNTTIKQGSYMWCNDMP